MVISLYSYVLAVVFRSMVHVKLIVVYGVRQESKFIPVHMDIQFSLYYFLKNLI